MLRETPIAYSSIPQDEGSNTHTSVMTRPPGNSRWGRDCKLTAIISSLVIVTGLLAVVLPIALRDRFHASGRDHLSEQVTGDLPNKLSTTEEVKTQTEGRVTNITEQPTGLAGHNTKNSSEKHTQDPVTPTTTTTTTTTTTNATTTTTTTIPVTTTTTIIITPKKTTVHSDIPVEPTGEGKPASSTVPKIDEGGQETTEDTQHTSPGVAKQNVTKDEILDAIYGSGDKSSKPNTPYDWVNNMMAEHDTPMLVAMAVLVAVAGAAVVSALSWLVYNRVTARRRSINMQSMITDLQSRDKVILLNSEESEEE